MHAALERDATVVPVLVVVSLLAFVGSVSIARYIGGMLLHAAGRRRLPETGTRPMSELSADRATSSRWPACWPAHSCA